MPIDGANVVKTKLFKQCSGHDHALGVFFEAARQFKHRRHVLQHRFAHVFGSGVKLSGQEPGQVAV